MTQIAQVLAEHGMILRSGGAPGADQAFEKGVTTWGKKQIFIPWEGFENRTTKEKCVYNLEDGDHEGAMGYFKKYHPGWMNVSKGGQRLHARNTYQVLGLDLDTPSLFVICWTYKGGGTGGTGQAIRLAKACFIPVFDLGSMDVEQVGIEVTKLMEKN